MESNPCKLVPRRKESKPRERVLTRDEWSALIEYVDIESQKHRSERWNQVPLYLRLSYATGRRRAELLNLEWVAVDLDKGILHLLDTKTGDDQSVPVDKAMVKRLKVHKHDGHYVFRGRFDDRPTDFDEIIREVFRELFPPDFRGEVPVLHSIRHTVATELGDGGATEAQIMAVTGHKSSASVNRYVKKTIEAARAAQAKR
jgi:integrase